MAVIRVINAQTISTSPTDSSSVAPDLQPDQYGTVIVTHSGTRLAAGSTVAAFLQGSLDDGTTWFDIECMKPSDTTYINGNANSWCRVVPLVKMLRVRIVNGGGLVYNAWVIE